ncbi:HD domain-containing phosphohydrolase [Oceanobacter mangrovi]|uniref:HD domain-containing phosphohydrolase n=1 Tax=Oceanobacter mangrovi TaxID=2862510 RepID=UPI001C8D8317|nr:HD domain-containing phosphohydrolase [Oceanobacter mangrovi]
MEKNYRILVVDDVAENIQVAMNILREDSYELSYATSGEKALELIRSQDFDLILLDIMMPGIDGFEVCGQLRTYPRYREVPVIFLTARADIDAISRGFEAGAVDYIIKPFHAAELLARVRTHLELHAARQVLRRHNLSLQEKVQLTERRLLTELEQNQLEMIHILTELMEFTSDETGNHIKRVADYSRLLAELTPALTEEDAEIIYHASPMHDIGKVFIPKEVLNKPGKLSHSEFEVMKTHTTKAHQFLQKSKRKLLKAADIIAWQHHERWDGAGYPRALKGEEIHIYGRIVAIADVFDALTHKRIYKPAWSMEDARDYILEHSGSHFDPTLVDLFQQHFDQFTQIAND